MRTSCLASQRIINGTARNNPEREFELAAFYDERIVRFCTSGTRLWTRLYFNFDQSATFRPSGFVSIRYRNCQVPRPIFVWERRGPYTQELSTVPNNSALPLLTEVRTVHMIYFRMKSTWLRVLEREGLLAWSLFFASQRPQTRDWRSEILVLIVARSTQLIILPYIENEPSLCRVDWTH